MVSVGPMLSVCTGCKFCWFDHYPKQCWQRVSLYSWHFFIVVIGVGQSVVSSLIFTSRWSTCAKLSFRPRFCIWKLLATRHTLTWLSEVLYKSTHTQTLVLLRPGIVSSSCTSLCQVMNTCISTTLLFPWWSAWVTGTNQSRS